MYSSKAEEDGLVMQQKQVCLLFDTAIHACSKLYPHAHHTHTHTTHACTHTHINQVEEQYLAQPSYGSLTTPAATTTHTTTNKTTSKEVKGKGAAAAGKGKGGRGAKGAASTATNTTHTTSNVTQNEGAAGDVSAAGGMTPANVQGSVLGAQREGQHEGAVLARRNGEGDVSSISSDVVRKLWPSILQVRVVGCVCCVWVLCVCCVMLCCACCACVNKKELLCVFE